MASNMGECVVKAEVEYKCCECENRVARLKEQVEIIIFAISLIAGVSVFSGVYCSFMTEKHKERLERLERINRIDEIGRSR
jgi:hypothetical protein